MSALSLGAANETARVQQLDWADGRNVKIDYRWGANDAERVRRYAAELVALAPDVILAHGSSTVRPLLQETHIMPIVFPVAADPVGGGLVDSLARHQPAEGRRPRIAAEGGAVPAWTLVDPDDLRHIRSPVPAH